MRYAVRLRLLGCGCVALRVAAHNCRDRHSVSRRVVRHRERAPRQQSWACCVQRAEVVEPAVGAAGLYSSVVDSSNFRPGQPRHFLHFLLKEDSFSLSLLSKTNTVCIRTTSLSLLLLVTQLFRPDPRASTCVTRCVFGLPWAFSLSR